MNALLLKSTIHKNLEKKRIDAFYTISANIIIGIGLILIIYAFCEIPNRPVQSKLPPKLERLATARKDTIQPDSFSKKNGADSIIDYWSKLGTIGDYVAGVGGTCFALGGFVYLFLSFRKQRESNELQLAAFTHDKIETRFFELIKLHRDNVNELKIIYYTHRLSHWQDHEAVFVKDEHVTEERQVFYFIVREFEDALNELNFLFENIDLKELYEVDYLTKLQSNNTLQDRKIQLLLYGKIDLIYLIVFFGVGKEGQNTIKSLAQSKYNPNFVNQLLCIAALKPSVKSVYWERWLRLGHSTFLKICLAEKQHSEIDFKDLKNKWRDESSNNRHETYYYRYVKYYGGHQFRLGHYFRHMFQSISFVNDQSNLNGEEQYDYVKHYRGQLSTYEQSLIFVNSISQLGRVWELEDKKTGGAVPRIKQLITDYQFIKNIPHDEVFTGIYLSDFYPGIKYEGFRNTRH